MRWSSAISFAILRSLLCSSSTLMPIASCEPSSASDTPCFLAMSFKDIVGLSSSFMSSQSFSSKYLSPAIDLSMYSRSSSSMLQSGSGQSGSLCSSLPQLVQKTSISSSLNSAFQSSSSPITLLATFDPIAAPAARAAIPTTGAISSR